MKILELDLQRESLYGQLELAVANSTSATFLRVVGCELIQKYLGDGPKLVRELFRLAGELSPSIVFIDDIDAVGAKRYDAHSGESKALLRPGRIDRKIEFSLPDIKTRRCIFQIHTSRMTLADDVNLEEFVMTKDEFSGANIKAICTEAGLLALREHRMMVMFKKKEGVPEGLLYMMMMSINSDMLDEKLVGQSAEDLFIIGLVHREIGALTITN
ncbi:hypothetical protein OPV22_018749 [Ensete ventricosum]|uniref:AAA+ ATPase domain-containing protein n=1 Tax=Ensete ventricosum TaxID=4639 RepID=A0AAV8QR59_ENSVE|nr:hypothetical protein OPV22_018749 [Ensete ventricosum]